MPMATIEVTMPGPTTAASMIAESTAGKAKVKSEKRMMISSIQPRLADAIRPRQTPNVRPMLTAMTPTRMVERAPASSSETMSRPKESVPSQWAADGGWSLEAMSISYGDHGVHTSDNSAEATTNRLSTPPTTKLRWRSARPQNVRAGTRGVATDAP